jgi:hypothetical protein
VQQERNKMSFCKHSDVDGHCLMVVDRDELSMGYSLHGSTSFEWVAKSFDIPK